MAGNRNSGRRPKSKVQRELHNSPERPHHRDRPEPEYDVDVPAAPETLNADGRTEWERITTELTEKRVIARVDLAALLIYCSLFSRLTAIHREMAKKSFRLLVKGRENPLVRMERQISGQMRAYLTELGITPASRAKVSPLPPLGAGADAPAAAAAPRVDDFDALEARLTQRKVVPIDPARKAKGR